MKTSLSVAVLVATLASLAACGGGGSGDTGAELAGTTATNEIVTTGPGDTERLYPNSVGNTWYYTVVRNGTETSWETVEIVPGKTVGAFSTVGVRSTDPFGNLPPTTQYVAYTAGGPVLAAIDRELPLTASLEAVVDAEVDAAALPYQMARFSVNVPGRFTAFERHNTHLPLKQWWQDPGDRADFRSDVNAPEFLAWGQPFLRYYKRTTISTSTVASFRSAKGGTFVRSKVVNERRFPDLGLMSSDSESVFIGTSGFGDPGRTERIEKSIRGWRMGDSRHGVSNPRPVSATAAPGSRASAAQTERYTLIVWLEHPTTIRAHWRGALVDNEKLETVTSFSLIDRPLTGTSAPSRPGVAAAVDRFVIVYGDMDGSVKTRVVNASNAPGSVSPETTIHSGPVDLTSTAPRVACSVSNCLVTYGTDSPRPRGTLLAQQVGVDGAALALPFVAETAPAPTGNISASHLVFDGTNYRLFTRLAPEGSASSPLRTRRISTAGIVLDTAAASLAFDIPRNDDLVRIAARTGEVLVTWVGAQSSTGRDRIFGARLSNNGDSLDGTGDALATGGTVESFDVAWYADNFALAWFDSGTAASPAVARGTHVALGWVSTQTQRLAPGLNVFAGNPVSGPVQGTTTHAIARLAGGAKQASLTWLDTRTATSPQQEPARLVRMEVFQSF